MMTMLLLLGLAGLSVVFFNRSKRGLFDKLARLVFAVILAGSVSFAVVLSLYAMFGELSTSSDNQAIISIAAAGSFALTVTAVLWFFLRGEAVRQSEAARAVQPVNQAYNERRPTPAVRVSFEPADVFISYKRDERNEVVEIAHRLQTLQLKVWFDAEMRSGTPFDTEIERQVRAARCVLVAWSPGAVASEWVRSEATIGRQRGVLAACILRDCDLPPPFNLVHAEDLRSGIGARNPEWLRLLERIGALVGRPGLASYEAAQSERAALAAWIADHPGDPLFESAVARLRG
jgi:hypothetical protein